MDKPKCKDCQYATYDGFCRYYYQYTLLDKPACVHIIISEGVRRYGR